MKIKAKINAKPFNNKSGTKSSILKSSKQKVKRNFKLKGLKSQLNLANEEIKETTKELNKTEEEK